MPTQVLEGGVPVAATGRPNAERDGWQIEGAGFEMFLVPLGPNREPSGLTPAGGLTVDQGGWMSLGGAGLRAQTTIKFFLLPMPSTQGLAPRAVQTPLYLGHADTSARGEFIDTVYIPSYATAGEWVLQAVGQKSRTTLRSINVRLNITDSQPDWEMQITQRAGFFTGRSAELSKQGKAKLRKLIGSVPMAADHVRVQVTGVSTSLDTRRSNKKLAERRATAVAEFLKTRSRDMTVTMRTTTQKTGSSNRDISQSPQPLFTREGKPLTTASVIYDVLQE